MPLWPSFNPRMDTATTKAPDSTADFLQNCFRWREAIHASGQYSVKRGLGLGDSRDAIMRQQLTSASRQLNQLLRLGTVAGMTDPQLLEQFVAGDDESAALAFEAIVERHGPMVLRVCRLVLRDAHAAEDALQATFLVLAAGRRR